MPNPLQEIFDLSKGSVSPEQLDKAFQNIRKNMIVPYFNDPNFGNDQELPFLIAVVTNNLSKLEPKDAEQLAVKMKSYLEQLYDNLDQRNDIEFEKRTAYKFMATNLHSAIDYSQNHNFKVENLADDEQKMHNFVEVLEHENDIKLMIQELEQYKAVLLENQQDALRESKSLSEKAQQSHSDRKQLISNYKDTHNKTETAAQAFNTFAQETGHNVGMIQNQIDNNPMNNKTANQSHSEYLTKLKKYKEDLAAEIRITTKASMSHADNLCNHPAVKQMHLQSPEQNRSKLYSACCKLFEKLHKHLPKIFREPLPDFLKTKEQKTAKEIQQRSNR